MKTIKKNQNKTAKGNGTEKSNWILLYASVISVIRVVRVISVGRRKKKNK